MAKAGSLSARAKMATKVFVRRVFAIFATNASFLRVIAKGWGLSAKLWKHSAIWGKLGTALQAYALNPCTKFPPNPTSRKVYT